MRRASRFLAAIALGASAALAACENAGQDRVLAIDASGSVVGIVYLDRDGNLEFEESADTHATGVDISLVPHGAREAVAVATSGQDGTFRFDAVPVGSYRVTVDTASIGDSLRVARIDTADISVAANGRAEVRVAVSYPSLPIAEARTRAVGEKVFVEGIVLNTLPTFGDSSMYIIDASAAIRVIRIPHSEATVGDSVRVLGIVGPRDGQPVLTDAGGVIPSRATAPPPELLSTATARTASSGTLDASLARITGATIVGSEVTSTQDLLLTVDDGSGPLEVLVAQST